MAADTKTQSRHKRGTEPRSEPPSASALLVPRRLSLASARRAAATCTACPLYARATQTVFGEGPASAALMMVGEEPGDREDLAGHVFVGPAGRELDRALSSVGIERDDVYLTNAVKHFKWEPRGKRRIHQKPSNGEVDACRGWLEAEIAVVQPTLIVCLGAVATLAILGRSVKVTERRGELFESRFGAVIPTVHPSSILRMPDEETRTAARNAFIRDLKRVVATLARLSRREHAKRALAKAS